LSASRPGRSERAKGIHWKGDWAGPSFGLDTGEEKNSQLLPGIEP